MVFLPLLLWEMWSYFQEELGVGAAGTAFGVSDSMQGIVNAAFRTGAAGRTFGVLNSVQGIVNSVLGARLRPSNDPRRLPRYIVGLTLAGTCRC